MLVGTLLLGILAFALSLALLRFSVVGLYPIIYSFCPVFVIQSPVHVMWSGIQIYLYYANVMYNYSRMQAASNCEHLLELLLFISNPLIHSLYCASACRLQFAQAANQSVLSHFSTPIIFPCARFSMCKEDDSPA